MKAKLIKEDIKHLSPKSEEELDAIAVAEAKAIADLYDDLVTLFEKVSGSITFYRAQEMVEDIMQEIEWYEEY